MTYIINLYIEYILVLANVALKCEISFEHFYP